MRPPRLGGDTFRCGGHLDWGSSLGLAVVVVSIGEDATFARWTHQQRHRQTPIATTADRLHS